MRTKFQLILATIAILTTTACNSGKKEQLDPAEKAMNTFIEKVNKTQYSIGVAGWRTAKVFSKDLVMVDYDDPLYDDDIYCTVNGNETYYAFITDGVFEERFLEYFGEGTAIETAKDILINYWFDLAGDNIWDAFTSYSDDSLKFKIISTGIITQLASYYGNVHQSDIGLIEEAHLIFADENVSKATVNLKFFAELGEEDINVDINFNVTKPENFAADAWMNNPNRNYPEAPNKWSDEDAVAFGSLFGQKYGNMIDELLPFPEFATVTFKRDGNATFMSSVFLVRDSRATEEGLNNYANKLVNQYNYDVVDEELSDGSTVKRYDLLIDTYQETHFMYISIYLEYNQGVTLLLQQNFNFIHYSGRNTINALIDQFTFPKLPYSSDLINFDSTDMIYPQSLGVNFMAEYQLALEVQIKFDDVVKASKYMDDYLSALKTYGYSEDDTSSLGHHTLETESFRSNFEYMIDTASNIIFIMFRNIKYLGDEVANEMIADMGFPAIHLENYLSHSRELTRFYEFQYSLKREIVLQSDITFTTPTEKVEFYVDLEYDLVADGFIDVDPLSVQVPYKNKAYYNESKGLIVAYNEDETNMSSLHFIKL